MNEKELAAFNAEQEELAIKIANEQANQLAACVDLAAMIGSYCSGDERERLLKATKCIVRLLIAHVAGVA